MHDTKRKHKIFFSHTPSAYSAKYFRFPRNTFCSHTCHCLTLKHHCLTHPFTLRITSNFSTLFQGYIYTQIDMFCLNIALKCTKKFTVSVFCILQMIYWFSISPLYWEFVFCFTFLNYINHSKFYYPDITSSNQHFERIMTLLTKVLIDE